MSYASGVILPDVKKIAVLRPNAVGDFIFALPCLHALRRAYRGARIVYVGRQWHADFWPAGPVDEVTVIPPCPGVAGKPVHREDVRGLPSARRLRMPKRWTDGFHPTNFRTVTALAMELLAV